MRALALVAAVSTIAFAVSSAQAAVIVQNASLFQASGDFASDIVALPFDAAIGELTDASLALSGFYTPATANVQAGTTPPASTNLITTLSVHPYGGGTYSSVIGIQSNVPVTGGGGIGAIWDATGTPTSVFQTFDFGALAAFAIPLSGVQPLANYIFTTSSPLGGGTSDLTRFQGQAVLTYTYTPQSVPEPATIATLFVGLFALGAARRRKSER